ncbi:hypothetical protein [Streptomyces sp. CBMAI 2042]|nr:hypothetical protein [Streptomyces sp. CBMAI 2042]
MKTSSPEDTEYRILLGHTISCPACRAGDPCDTAARLRAAVRQARRH